MKRKIIPDQKYTTYASFPLVAGDVRAYEIQLDLGENVDNAEFKVTAFRSDGEVIEDLGSVEGGICRYTIQNNMYSVPGELTIRLAVVHNSSVLTDREIIFEVLSGSGATLEPSTAVTINDSVILRISSLEEKLSLKNDFTDDYKQKLDNLVCGVSSVNDKTGDVLLSKEDVGLSNVDNTSDLDKPISNATQEALDLKADKKELAKKADKSDITNLYKFKGSVDTYDGLYSVTPILKEIPLIPAGEPLHNGEGCGSFDESTNAVTIYGDGDGGNSYNDITIPVQSVTLEPGYYHFDWWTNSVSLLAYLQDATYIDARMCSAEHEDDAIYSVIKIESEAVVDYVELFGSFYHNDETHNRLGVLYKIADVCVGEGYGDGYYPTTLTSLTNNADVGDTYNVTDTDMNYAWNGEAWDALGGKHIDQEARDGIFNLNEAVGELADAKAEYTYVDGRINEESEWLSGEISNLGGRVGGVESDIASLNESLNTKAEMSDISDLGGTLMTEIDNKANLNEVSNALKGSASGEVIFLNDVSPVGHTLDVKVRSKNLVDLSMWSTRGCIIDNNGTVTSNINNSQYAELYIRNSEFINFLLANKGKTLTFSIAETLEDRYISMVIFAKKADGSDLTIAPYKKNSNKISAVISEEVVSISEIDLRFNWQSGVNYVDTTTTISNIQLEISDTPTEYTPYIEDLTGVKLAVSESGDVYTPNSDGTVEGVQSISPNMTLTTDTEGVAIDCKYNKDANKVIESLTNAIISLGGNV